MLDLEFAIDIEEKRIFIASENSSGCYYDYKNLSEIGEIINKYIKLYC